MLPTTTRNIVPATLDDDQSSASQANAGVSYKGSGEALIATTVSDFQHWMSSQRYADSVDFHARETHLGGPLNHQSPPSVDVSLLSGSRLLENDPVEHGQNPEVDEAISMQTSQHEVLVPTSLIYKSNLIAAFFGSDPRDVVAQAAEFLLQQLGPERLEAMQKNNREISIFVRCSPPVDHEGGECFFLEVSSFGSNGCEIVGGEPATLLACTTYAERLNYVVDLLDEAIVAFDDCMLDAWELATVEQL